MAEVLEHMPFTYEVLVQGPIPHSSAKTLATVALI